MNFIKYTVGWSGKQKLLFSKYDSCSKMFQHLRLLRNDIKQAWKKYLEVHLVKIFSYKNIVPTWYFADIFHRNVRIYLNEQC